MIVIIFKEYFNFKDVVMDKVYILYRLLIFEKWIKSDWDCVVLIIYV